MAKVRITDGRGATQPHVGAEVTRPTRREDDDAAMLPRSGAAPRCRPEGHPAEVSNHAQDQDAALRQAATAVAHDEPAPHQAAAVVNTSSSGHSLATRTPTPPRCQAATPPAQRCLPVLLASSTFLPPAERFHSRRPKALGWVAGGARLCGIAKLAQRSLRPRPPDWLLPSREPVPLQGPPLT